MKDINYRVLYWLSIAIALFQSFTGMYITATLWMMISAVYLVGDDILKELRKQND